MAERVGDFEWRDEGDEAEILLYAPTDRAFGRVLPAASLPGVRSPVYAAATEQSLGWCAASSSHAAPDLISVPARGLLLTAGVSVDNLGQPPAEIPRLLLRNLSEINLPRLDGGGVRNVCESGARAAAEIGLIEEEDLPFFESAVEGSGADESDALGRRALVAGGRDWDRPADVSVRAVGEVFDAGEAEKLDLGPGSLALVIRGGAGELGRLALAAHQDRILSRVRAGDLGDEEDLPAASLDSEEAADLLAAVRAAANFADGRAALSLFALRRASEGFAGSLRLRAAWMIGGFEEREGLLVHRRGLAHVGSGVVLVSGETVAAGMGAMLNSAPPFGAAETDGIWPWEEAGLVERMARLGPLEVG